MKTDFDTIYNRRETGCIKWSRNPYSHPDPIPMGIADMEFAVPDFVLEAMKNRMNHPIFGYFRPEQRFWEAIVYWQKQRFGVEVSEECLLYQSSVLGGIATAVELLSKEGDAVIVQTPAYTNFGTILGEHNRKLIANPLRWDGKGYCLDLEDFERKIIENRVKLFLFCSPHNPTGRVWTEEELKALDTICQRHGVKVIADEIWSDLILEGKHIPMHTVSEKAGENTISLYSPTKSFNIAGLGISYAVIFNEEVRDSFKSYGEKTHYNNSNQLSMEALIAAYNHGSDWLKELCIYLGNNIEELHSFFSEKLPGVVVSPMQGTYLVWLDFSNTDLSSDQLMELSGREGLYFNDGRGCVANGDRCLRMNAAMPLPRLKEALTRMERAFSPYCG